MMQNQIKIRYAKYGLANFFGNYIEINEKLKYDKALRDYIVKHELGHSVNFDLGYEFLDGLKMFKTPKMSGKLLWFYITTPTAWTDLLPIQIKKKAIIYDVNLSILYAIIIGGLALALKIFI